MYTHWLRAQTIKLLKNCYNNLFTIFSWNTMLYLFTGNNSYLIIQEAQKWKNAFKEKYGEENVIHISSLETVSSDFISKSLLGRSLFSEKRLVIIDGFPLSWERQFSWAADIEKIIIETLENIPEETLVVFLSVSPDKRKTSYKTLSKLSEIKEFSSSGEGDTIQILQKSYSDVIDYRALKLLVMLKWGDLQKSISEIEKLKILKNKIELIDIESHTTPEFEESIFVFIDTLLSKNPKKIFSDFHNLLSFSNFYSVYQSVIANLRVFLYIELLKSQKKSLYEIGNILKLWNRQFLIQKNYRANLSDIRKLYINLLNFDKNMKFWNFLSSDEKDLQKEVEGVFLIFLSE